MKTPLRRMIAALSALILSLSLIGCANAEGKDDSLIKILDAGQFVLGFDGSFPPMGFADENGEAVGFDIDVAREVCARLGVKLVTKVIDWGEKEEELNSGRIDCIWNGMSVTPARRETMALSDPYMNNSLIVVIPGSSTANTMQDLKGKRIGVQDGSTAEETLEALPIRKDVTPVSYEDVLLLLEALSSDELDAVIIDSVVAYYYIFSTDKPYYILADGLGEEEYAIGFRKDDLILRDRIVQLLTDMKTDGTLAAISEKWFGSDITTIK